ncbi:YjjW family glycine radical enzyme activase [bacterium 210820-DFI.6.52]|nr:YjjW family glycine radical enzyme activase [bacterium 210820-DFI.6.52]
MLRAPVNKIIPQSSVDGPGNRTAIFFQGCNFSCHYCHNPETIRLCQNCGTCVADCPVGALQKDEAGTVCWDPALCVGCDTCIKVCPHLSSPKVRLLTVEEVLAEVEKGRSFIRGITVSGGECTLYRDFLISLFERVHSLGLTALLDSNGSRDFSADAELLDACDGVMLDIKCFDSAIHQKLTGQPSERVRENAVFLAKKGKLTEIRTVIIPDYLPNEETVRGYCELLAPYLSAGPIRYKLIRFRPFGVREPYNRLETPSEEYMEQLAEIAKGYGFADVVTV